MKQLSFLPPTQLDHGGDIRAGKRKMARPFDPKRPLHVVMRSTRARGAWSLLQRKNSKRVDSIVHATARKYGVRVYRFVNVGNHLHFLLSAKKRKDLQAFLRVTAGAIAFQVTGAKKTNAQGRFWDKLAYSRIVSWGREFRALQKYLVENLFEAVGAWKREKHLQLILMTPQVNGRH